MSPVAAPANGAWIYDAILRRIHVTTHDGRFAPSLTPPATAVPGSIESACISLTVLLLPGVRTA
jgi:hypothetical protein